MEIKLKEEIEEYIEDWHWDDGSKKIAYDMGKFMFAFMDYLDDQKLSEKTKRIHQDNIGLIGMFESGYGYRDEFSHEDLEDGPNYLYEFERKVSDSKYAIQSYKATWKKLDKFIKSGTYEEYVNTIEKKLAT